MIVIAGGDKLLSALQKQGLLPPECAGVEVLVFVDGVTQLRYTVNVYEEQYNKLATAFAEAALPNYLKGQPFGDGLDGQPK